MFEPTILKRENLTKVLEDVQLKDAQMMPLMASGILAKNSTDQTNISYDIGVPKRDIGVFQGHGTPAGTRKLEVYDKASFEFPHTFESKTIKAATSLNLRNPGSQKLQQIGTDQVTKEQVDNARHLNRQDEYLIAGMLQGSVSMKLRSGAQERSFTMDYKVPSDHKLAYGGEDLGNTCLQTPWSTSSAKILDDIDVFLQKVEDDCGYTLRHAFTGREVLTAMVQNDIVKHYFKGSDAGRQFVTKGEVQDPIKDITWHPHNHTYVPEGGAATRFIPKGRIIFTPDADANWGEWFDAAAATDGPNGPEKAIGRYSFAKSSHNPPSDEIFYGACRGGVLYVPKAILIVDVFSS